MADLNAVKSTVKNYILEEFLPGEDPDELTDSLEMMNLGILDSVSVLQLVTFMEEQFDVTFEANEVGADHMNTLEDIGKLICSKL